MTKTTQRIQTESKYILSVLCLVAILLIPVISAYADSEWISEPKEKTKDIPADKGKPSGGVTTEAIIATIPISTASCNHYATLSNKCYGFDNVYSSFYYNTPATFVRPNICTNYTCEDTDLYLQYPSQITYNGYVYTFSSATTRGCAPNLSLCNNPLTFTQQYSISINEYKIPTDTPIQYTTTYNYIRGSNTVQIQSTNYLTNGYS